MSAKSLAPHLRRWQEIGDLQAFLADKLNFLLKQAQEHGDVVPMRLGGHTLLLRDHEDICHVLEGKVDARDQLPDLRTLHVPPLFDYQPVFREPRSEPQLLPQLGFVANFAWWPNRVSLRWLLDKVLPLVTRDLRLNLYGEGSERVRTSDRRVVCHGFVSDLSRVLALSDLMLCPVLAGGGVSVKLAEALYNGVPVLATPRAARALRLPDLTGIAVVDGVEGWARFLNREGLDTLAAKAVPTVTSNLFAPSTHAEALHAFLKS